MKDRDGSDLAEARKVSREQVHDLKHPTVRRRQRSRPDVFGAYGKRLIEARSFIRAGFCKSFHCVHFSASVLCLTRYLK